ncbi:DTW domain-containing protein [Catenovulum sp. SM1970]|uniref:DTW domain-containing protein n=1 Tax=Marinifaba aquimaris TaxID=2741323 RepID=UPI001572DDDF|nr:tRNA-uridine aminocarboxypropyltransferase [Marinifaba aquimaris]NTS78806.1 DTW domain-containing protein [Marinifaba aquimaris]
MTSINQNKAQKSTLKRPYCDVCARPQKTCICHCVTPVSNQTPIHIIQHPDETKQAKGTAKLASLCLSSSTLSVLSESKSVALSEVMHVLFPAPNANELSENDREEITAQGGLHILDGTWRQANQLIRLLESRSIDIVFHTLSTIDYQSRYRQLRKTKKQGAFSTIEAIYLALSVLDSADVAEPLIESFNQFLEFQNQFQPNREQN